jgi:hypothetical protein
VGANIHYIHGGDKLCLIFLHGRCNRASPGPTSLSSSLFYTNVVIAFQSTPKFPIYIYEMELWIISSSRLLLKRRHKVPSFKLIKPKRLEDTRMLKQLTTSNTTANTRKTRNPAEVLDVLKQERSTRERRRWSRVEASNAKQRRPACPRSNLSSCSTPPSPERAPAPSSWLERTPNRRQWKRSP